MKKQLLIIVATHGNEAIGLEVIEKLRAKKLDKYFDTLIGNPLAWSQKVRFVERDLNRSYPGSVQSRYYEERQADKNLRLSQQYEYVIDIHEASSGTDDFIIVPKDSLPSQFPVNLLPLNDLLFWPNPPGPLCSVIDNGVELEFGVKNRERSQVIARAVSSVETFIASMSDSSVDTKTEKSLYRVYGKIMVDDPRLVGEALADFQEVNLGGEIFLPLLINQYLELGIYCYKMKRVIAGNQ